MKKVIFIFVFFIYTLQVQSTTTEFSKFAEQQYLKQKKIQISINVKKEHKEQYLLNINEQNTVYIVYGWGDAKLKKYKKCRVSYITLNDCNNIPVWSTITISP